MKIENRVFRGKKKWDFIFVPKSPSPRSNSFQPSRLQAEDDKNTSVWFLLCVCKLPRLVRTGTEENNGFEVGVFIRVWRQFQHAVTELLHPPNVLHDQFDSFRWQFLCEMQGKTLEEVRDGDPLNSTKSFFLGASSSSAPPCRQTTAEPSYLPVSWSADGW